MTSRLIALFATGVFLLCFHTGRNIMVHADDREASSPNENQSDETDTKTVERFDYRVREDFFAGVEGDEKALDRVVEACEEVLKENPRHAEALVWRGAVRVFRSGKLFGAGDPQNGMQNWVTGMKDMDDAVKIAPDHIGVLIPRAAVLLNAGRNSPPIMGVPVLKKVRDDFERTYNR